MGCECEHTEDIAMMKKTLYGNGKPQESVVTQVHSMKKSVGRLELIGWGLIAGVNAADLKGKP